METWWKNSFLHPINYLITRVSMQKVKMQNVARINCLLKEKIHDEKLKIKFTADVFQKKINANKIFSDITEIKKCVIRL